MNESDINTLQFFFRIIPILGLLQGLFLGITLLKVESKNKRANYFLSALIFLFCMVFAHQYFVETDWIQNNLYFFYFSIATPLLIGPCLYFYSSLLIEYKKIVAKIDFAHLIPFIITILYFLYRYINPDIVDTVRSKPGEVPLYITITGIVKILHMLSYGILTFIQLRLVYKKDTKHSKENLLIIKWLYIFTYGFLISIIIGILSFAIGHLDIPLVWIVDEITPIAILILLYIVAYVAIRNPIILTKASLKKKYESSTLDVNSKLEIIKNLDNFLSEHKPYLNPELKINDIAENLSITSHHLSQVINEEHNLTFKEFINSYRVNEVKQRLIDPTNNHKTFLAIAMESGFNSKAVFNRAFKKFVGVSPQEYKNNNQPK